MTAMTNRCGVAFLLVGWFALAGCGDDITSQMSARDAATKHICDRAQTCGLIGAGLTYQNRDDCDVKQRDNWQTQWPPSECDGHIDQTQLNACLTNIDAIQCSDIGAGLLSVALTCGKARVCSANL
jgi:hypothetical protein